MDIFQNWTETIRGSTWKAICRKNGIHQYKKGALDGVNYDWNAELAEPLTKYLDKYLNKLTNRILPAVQNEQNAQLEEAGKLFPRSLEESSLAITEHAANPLQNFLYNLQRLEVEMRRGVEARFAEAVVLFRTADRKVSDVIELSMKPGYAEARGHSGEYYFLTSCLFNFNG